MSENPDTDFVAYVAGFFDGEGNVQLTYRKGRQRQWVQYAVRITNTDLDILREIQRAYGGNILASQSTYRLIYKLCLTQAGTVQPFLESVLPHLRLKYPQAKLLLRYLERKKGTKITDAEIEMCRSMKTLNSASRRRAA